MASSNGTDPIVPMPWDARTLAMSIMAILAVVFALQWAQKFIIPLLLGIILAYTLNPLVVRLERIKIPRVIGATLVMLAILGGSVCVVLSLRSQIETIVDQLPEAAHKLSRVVLAIQKNQPKTMQQVQAAAHEFEQAANQAAGVSSTAKQAAIPIVIDRSSFKLGEFLWTGSVGLFGFIGDAVMLLILVFFLLVSGDTFKRKLIRVTGPSLSQRNITVHMLEEINTSVQRYMFTLLVVNVLLAFMTWITFALVGLENAGAWAVAAGVLHVIPYAGPALLAGASGLVAFMQFESLWMALLVAGSSLAIATLVGMFVMTWMNGRLAKMNAVAVFVALLFWGWLWGAWGLLLAIPIIGILKVISEHVKVLHPLTELLGEEGSPHYEESAHRV